MDFANFIVQIGKKTDELSIDIDSIVNNTDKARFEIKLTHEPCKDFEIDDVDVLMDYIAEELSIFVDGLNGEYIYCYYNIKDGSMAYYDVADKCCYNSYNIKNQALLPFIDKMQCSEDVIGLLEAIGIYIYQKYGKDCYNYSISGSPVNVEYLKQEILDMKGADYQLSNKEDAKTLAEELLAYWKKLEDYEPLFVNIQEDLAKFGFTVLDGGIDVYHKRFWYQIEENQLAPNLTFQELLEAEWCYRIDDVEDDVIFISMTHPF